MGVIGVTGFMRSGKDTVAKFIAEKYNFSIYHFAAPIKEAAKVIFNWTDDHVYGDLKDVVDPNYGIAPRLALQLIGTEFAQYLLPNKSIDFQMTVGKNLWANRFKNMYLSGKAYENWIIPDLRFPHEVDMIRELKGTIIKVDRKSVRPSGVVHESESFINSLEHDYLIENDGSLDDLYKNVMSIFG